jgi:hypothetical protein
MRLAEIGAILIKIKKFSLQERMDYVYNLIHHFNPLQHLRNSVKSR